MTQTEGTALPLATGNPRPASLITAPGQALRTHARALNETPRRKRPMKLDPCQRTRRRFSLPTNCVILNDDRALSKGEPKCSGGGARTTVGKSLRPLCARSSHPLRWVWPRQPTLPEEYRQECHEVGAGGSGRCFVSQATTRRVALLRVRDSNSARVTQAISTSPDPELGCPSSHRAR